MRLSGSSGWFCVLAICCAGISGVQAAAAPAPTFTITATNVTMPSGGNAGSSQFTLTSVNGYSGKLTVNCGYSGGNMGAKVPTCGIYTAPLYTLGANQTVTGTLSLFPYGKIIPVSQLHGPRGGTDRAPALGLAVVCIVLLSRRLRGKARTGIGVILLGAIGLAGISACGNSLSGTFPYNVTAVDTSTQASVSTSMTVTVP